MTLFNLPDLGEGLPDAEIREWFVQIDEYIKLDQPMVAMETAKAVVDIPAPFSGKVTQLYGGIGDIIKTGAPLIDIEEENQQNTKDKATVVGNLESGSAILQESAMGIEPKSSVTHPNKGVKATPAIRALAKKLHVNLADCHASGPDGQITVADLEKMPRQETPEKIVSSSNKTLPAGYEPLRGVRRAMAIAMKKAHQSIVPVTLVDDADIHIWQEKTDITLRLIRAIMAACQREPRLNAWFDETNWALCQRSQIDLGIAIDAPEGLFVPVLRDIARSSAINLRQSIDKFKAEVKNRSVSPEDLLGATLVLSNVGVFAGRYASPIIIPPMVAILAVGRITESVVAEQGKLVVHKLLPLSLTVDHRVITGGEAARFLSALIMDLQAA
jgi:2-oxoisovalerate dehydrogenase E2 component (dihydrolipoyl transacylase)